MVEVTRISIDTSKYSFALHGVDERGHGVLRRELRRAQVEPFFAKLPPTEVVLEACGGSHHWGRRLAALGHFVRLIPPQYVKPFVKRGKNDRIDAEAISEAAGRPGMRFVPLKAAKDQAEGMVLSVRELLVKQRVQLANAMRGHAAEFGVVVATGAAKVAALAERVAEDPAVPGAAREMLVFLAQQVAELDGKIAELDHKLAAQHKANPISRQLGEVPGIGPIGALTLALKIDAKRFRSGRHLAAWLGLTPQERSTGGKVRLGRISRAGDERLRQLLVLGATSVIKVAKPGSKHATPWLMGLLERRPYRVAAVALANKMARIVWAMMTSGEAYRAPRTVPAAVPAAAYRPEAGPLVTAGGRREAAKDGNRSDRRADHPARSNGARRRCRVRELPADPIWARGHVPHH